MDVGSGVSMVSCSSSGNGVVDEERERIIALLGAFLLELLEYPCNKDYKYWCGAQGEGEENIWGDGPVKVGDESGAAIESGF
jgi:hypothetical protein